jgi:glucosamine-6-phosphate deaminase
LLYKILKSSDNSQKYFFIKFLKEAPIDIIIKDSYEQMSRFAAEIIANQIKLKPSSVLGLATGSTPLGTYRELIKMHREGLDFSRVKTFNLDEYLGIGIETDKPYAIDQSYARFMHEELFKHINIKKENIHIPDGLSEEPERFCQSYEDMIKKAGGIDLQLLGIGRNGHWAFNEPGSSLSSRTRVIPLTEQTLNDNYESFYKKAKIKREDMPHSAITMGMATILEARQLLMLACGKNKSKAIAEALQGPVTPQVPASAIQIFKGKATVVLDKDAASGLAV